jgi:NAD+ dependent glucose-6-phosphate dehydrogenase
MCPDETRHEDEGDALERPSRGGEGPSEPVPEQEPEPGTEAETPDAETPEPGTPAKPFRGLDVLSPDDFDDDDDDDGGDDVFDDDNDEDDDDDEFDDVRVVLITGASGNIAQKLRAAWADLYDMILIDKEASPDDREVIIADLSVLDEGWLTHFHGVDTVIHLAANPNDSASWEELQGPNLDALANVLHACALAGVERVIFASSNHAVGQYRELGDMPITADLPPRPDGPYGATKLVGERLGRSLALAFDITFIALRLGWVQPGDNRADTLPDDWSRSLWLSNGDLIRLFEAAIEAELGDRQFLVVNGMSNNRGMRWDISRTSDLLGYVPEDDAYAEEI